MRLRFSWGVAICHSDIAFAEGLWGGVLPAVYGHEAAGRNGGRSFCERNLCWDRVVVTMIRACGHCLGVLQVNPPAVRRPRMPRVHWDQSGQTLHQEWPVEHLRKWLWMQAGSSIPAAFLLGYLSTGVWSDHGGRRLCIQPNCGQPGYRCDWSRRGGPQCDQGARIAGARRIVALIESDKS